MVRRLFFLVIRHHLRACVCVLLGLLGLVLQRSKPAVKVNIWILYEHFQYLTANIHD